MYHITREEGGCTLSRLSRASIRVYVYTLRSVYVYIQERGGCERENGEVERERKKTRGTYVVEDRETVRQREVVSGVGREEERRIGTQ